MLVIAPASVATLWWSRPAPAPDQALDAFAGQTVTNPDMGLALIASRAGRAPRVGDLAPDFELPRMGEDSSLRLSSLRGGKPVVLVFGSYT